MKTSGRGICIDNEKVCILLYVDDIVLLANSADELSESTLE